MFIRDFLLFAAALHGFEVHSQSSTPKKVLGAYNQEITQDWDPPPDQAATRSYIKIRDVTEVPGGFKFTVFGKHGFYNSKLSLRLQIPIDKGDGTFYVFDVAQLSDKLADNPTTYDSNRTYTFTYDQLDKEIHKRFPKATGVKTGPGQTMYVAADWPDLGHDWGSYNQDGAFKTPGKSVAQDGPAIRIPITDQEVMVPIDPAMHRKYQDRVTGESGLLKGGQIRSQIEAESKIQIPVEECAAVKKKLFDLLKNQKSLERIGTTPAGQALWKIELVDRYYNNIGSPDPKKDPWSHYEAGPDGYPKVVPITDIYYDTFKPGYEYFAAKNGMAIRVRQGNEDANRPGGTALNFKPVFDAADTQDLRYRLEYGIDMPSARSINSMKPFINSRDPLNPLAVIYEKAPGLKPSDFMSPALEIVDVRDKFLLKYDGSDPKFRGLSVEISLDKATGRFLRDASLDPFRFCQIEMELDHVGLQSKNSAVGSVSGDLGMTFKDPTGSTFDSKATIASTEPSLHSLADLDPASPLRQSRKADFDMVNGAIRGLVKELFGNNWMPAPQKYGFGAAVASRLDAARRPRPDPKPAQTADAKGKGKAPVAPVTVSQPKPASVSELEGVNAPGYDLLVKRAKQLFPNRPCDQALYTLILSP